MAARALAGGLTRYRVNTMRAITWYWHFVIVLTVVVTAVLLSARGMSTCGTLGILQWVGLLLGAAVWITQHLTRLRPLAGRLRAERRQLGRLLRRLAGRC